MNNYILKTLINVRQETLKICAPLAIEDYSVQPEPFVSPPKWHLAHTTWFFEEFVLRPFLANFIPYNERFGTLFNSYYKSWGGHWPQDKRGILSRPTVLEIIDYRKYIDSHLEKLLSKDISNKAYKPIEIGIHHELQHHELLYMDIKYILSLNHVDTIYRDTPCERAPEVLSHWKNFSEEIIHIGHDGEKFSYDNEKPKHKVYMYPFSISETLVSNGDFLEFVLSSNYANYKYWLSIGYDWINKENIAHPLYWKCVNKEWFEYTLYGWQKLDPNAPLVHISYFEADAFAQWKNARLPSEYELEIYLESQNKINNKYKKNLHPHSIAAEEQVWTWSRSAYGPYPGYKPFDNGLFEYNGKFMCQQMVLKGGSVVTPQGHYRPTYRNFFLPSMRWMFSGIRLAKDLS